MHCMASPPASLPFLLLCTEYLYIIYIINIYIFIYYIKVPLSFSPLYGLIFKHGGVPAKRDGKGLDRPFSLILQGKREGTYHLDPRTVCPRNRTISQPPRNRVQEHPGPGRPACGRVSPLWHVLRAMGLSFQIEDGVSWVSAAWTRSLGPRAMRASSRVSARDCLARACQKAGVPGVRAS